MFFEAIKKFFTNRKLNDPDIINPHQKNPIQIPIYYKGNTSPTYYQETGFKHGTTILGAILIILALGGVFCLLYFGFSSIHHGVNTIAHHTWNWLKHGQLSLKQELLYSTVPLVSGAALIGLTFFIKRKMTQYKTLNCNPFNTPTTNYKLTQMFSLSYRQKKALFFIIIALAITALAVFCVMRYPVPRQWLNHVLNKNMNSTFCLATSQAIGYTLIALIALACYGFKQLAKKDGRNFY